MSKSREARARIAWLSAETPDRDGGGGHRRQYHQIRALLTAGIDIQVATLAGPQDDQSIRALTSVERFGGLHMRGFVPDERLDRFLADGSFDGAVVAHIESLPHVRRSLARHRIRWLLDFHNVNSRWHRARRETAAAVAWTLREHKALRGAAMATACSLEERAALLRAAPGAHVEVAGHGIASEEWPEDALAADRPPVHALFGAWSHEPNSQGAEWFARRVWPKVLTAVPEARLVLAGPGQPPHHTLAMPNVEQAGRVADLARFLGGVRVVVVPIVGGIGARMKFGEALASGTAVVSTSIGAEGFDAEGTFVRADDPDEFARACIDLLRHPDRARSIGRAGRNLAFQQLGWRRTSQPILRWAAGAV